MKTARYIINIWMTVSILLAGFLARSAEFHAWLHAGEEFCHIDESLCPHKGQSGHHHEGEGTEEHPHGLLTLMAGAAIESPIDPAICPLPDHTRWTFIAWTASEIPSSRKWKATMGRAPPVCS